MENRSKTAGLGVVTVAVVLLLGSRAFAGVHISTDVPNALPVAWRGYLIDLRALRLSANPLANTAKHSLPLRERYLTECLALEARAKSKALTADDLADLGGLYLRLGQIEKALGTLSPAARTHPEHFRIAANLGTTWQLLGELDRAADQLEEAVRLAPKTLRDAEALQLKLVRARFKEKKNPADMDDLFDLTTLPANALPLAQQLCVWLPNDARLLWQLGEVTHAQGDVRTAANLLDGAVAELGLASEAARSRRKLFRADADELEKSDEHKARFAGVKFASTRLFPKRFDVSQLPKIDAKKPNPLPWGALDETEIGKGFKVTALKYVSELDGRTVSISGFMQPQRSDEITTFLLTEFPIGCWFCESPSPLQLVQVELPTDKPVSQSRGLVTVTGTWHLNRTDPERMLFTITGANVRLAE